MNIDITSFFFNSTIEGATATCAWGTSIGQSKNKECRIETDSFGVNDFLAGLVYKSKSDIENFDISKGSKNREYLIRSIFDKVFVNGIRVKNNSFIVLLARENSASHSGRLIISYPPYASYKNDDMYVSNEATIAEMFNVLGCKQSGCWFSYDISVVNQDELHFSCVVVNKDNNMVYRGKSSERSAEWASLIPDEEHRSFVVKISSSLTSRQIIYYGAPGTGKSHKIKEILGEYEGCPVDKKVPKENIFRTTFHPDSDYSTFVGAYKPIMEKSIDKIYDKGELISKLTEMKEGGVTYSPQKFGAKYWRSLKQLNLSDKKDILQACGMSDNYTVEFDKGMAVGEEYLACSNESRIIYSFVPQAFLNAYIQAYRKPEEKVYLIIEEINRGNCAQIFGDLFQLLDRDANGKSEYSIKADADLRAFLEEKLGEDNPGIKDGELCLPSNLYIYATMNTSDQSLFPIDSAFKRRWDWEYEPIKYKNTDWKIVIDGTEYSWTSFQRKVNDKILSATSSEDKMLGDYFVNPSDGVITEKVLLNKILFYLWNDVCKDGEGDIFKNGETEEVTFSELYGNVGKQKLISMMDYLNIFKFENNEDDIDDNDDSEIEAGNMGKDMTRYSINVVGKYAKKNLAAELVKLYITQNPTLSASEVVGNWKSLGKFVSHFVETQEEYDTRTDKEPRVRVLMCNNENIYVSTNGWGGQGIMDSLISAIPESWNLKVEKLQ